MPLGKLSIRELTSRPVRTLLTLISIVLGVAAIVSTSLSSHSARLAQEALAQSITGKAALEVEAAGGNSFDSALLEQIEKLAGVEVASPVIRRFSNMQVTRPTTDDTNKRKLPGSYRVQLLGVVPERDSQVRGYSVVEGRALTYETNDRQSVLMDAGFAQAARIKVGDEIKLLTRSLRQSATVIGLIKPNDASAGLQSGLVIAQLKTIQKWSQANGKLDAIQIVLSKSTKVESMMEQISQLLPTGISVREPSLRSQVAGETTNAMQQGLQLAAGFALFLASFIIYNTFQMNVGERRRHLGILRSMGALRRQLLWMIVREGLWLGVLGAALGCVAGGLGASLFNQATSKLLQISVPPAPWSIQPYLIAVLAGMLVTLVGSIFPALRASRLSPSDAMKVVATGEFASSRIGWLIVGSVAIVIGIVVQFLSTAHYIDFNHAIAGAMIMNVGIVLLLPGIIRELTQVVVWILTPVLRVEANLAQRQILRHRGRSSLTIGIIFMALSVCIGMASTILDYIGNVETWYRKAIIGDFFIRAAMPDMNSGQSADMPDGLTEQVEAMPGVELVDTLRFVRARSGINSVIIVVRKFNSETQDYFDLIEGEETSVMDGLKNGEVVLGSVLSKRLNLSIGDSIPLETNEGSTELKVAGVTNEFVAGGLTLYLEAEAAKRLLSVEGTDSIVVRTEKGKTKEVGERLRELSDESGLMFQSHTELIKIIRDTLNSVVAGLWIVLLGSFLIAAFGLINTLAMNILEQTREIGLLRVVAMTRWQVRRTILAQAIILGSIGIVPGVLMSVWISYLLNLPTYQVTGHDVEFRVYPWLLIGSPCFEMLIVIGAALIPAERAARIQLSTALQYE